MIIPIPQYVATNQLNVIFTYLYHVISRLIAKQLAFPQLQPAALDLRHREGGEMRAVDILFGDGAAERHHLRHDYDIMIGV